MRALIKSTTPRFRRAGIEFNAKGVEIDLETLRPDQVEAIYQEPRLSVELLGITADLVIKHNQQTQSQSQPATSAGSGGDGVVATSETAGAPAPAVKDAAPAPVKPAKPASKPKATKA